MAENERGMERPFMLPAALLGGAVVFTTIATLSTSPEVTKLPSTQPTTQTERPVGKYPTFEECEDLAGGDKIFCTAEQYKGIYTAWGAGHGSVRHFNAGCPDPSQPEKNTPHGGPSNGANGGQRGNGSPCAMDGGSYIWVSINNAGHTDFKSSTIQRLNRNPHFVKIKKKDARRGDIALTGNTESGMSAGIFDKQVGTNSRVLMAGRTGTRIGEVDGRFDSFLRFVG